MKNTLTKLFLFTVVLSCLVLFGNSALAASVVGVDVGSVAPAATPDGDDDDDDDSCAASYVLGDEDPRLDTIRAFRDVVLAKTPGGVKLMDMYYANGDAINGLLENNPLVKTSAETLLEALLPAMELMVDVAE